MLTLTLDPFHWTGRFKLKAIAASASNTWGLFWLVLLLAVLALVLGKLVDPV